MTVSKKTRSLARKASSRCMTCPGGKPEMWRCGAETVDGEWNLCDFGGMYVFFLWFFSVRNRWDLDLMFFFYGNYDLFRVLQNIIQIVESQDWCSGHKWPNMRGVMTARLLQSDNSMWGPYMRYLHYGFRLHMMESVFHYVLGKNLTPPFSKVSNRRRA